MEDGVPCAMIPGMMQTLGIHIDIARYHNEGERNACHIPKDKCQLQLIFCFRFIHHLCYLHSFTG